MLNVSLPYELLFLVERQSYQILVTEQPSSHHLSAPGSVAKPRPVSPVFKQEGYSLHMICCNQLLQRICAIFLTSDRIQFPYMYFVSSHHT
jgi:hypothetical protein